MFSFLTFYKMPCKKSRLSLCGHEVVSERFHNSRNENDMNYKNSHRIKFSVFVLRRSLCWFSLNYVNKSGVFFEIIRNEYARKRYRVSRLNFEQPLTSFEREPVATC